jgi:hypothetical protein
MVCCSSSVAEQAAYFIELAESTPLLCCAFAIRTLARASSLSLPVIGGAAEKVTPFRGPLHRSPPYLANYVCRTGATMGESKTALTVAQRRV